VPHRFCRDWGISTPEDRVAASIGSPFGRTSAPRGTRVSAATLNPPIRKSEGLTATPVSTCAHVYSGRATLLRPRRTRARTRPVRSSWPPTRAHHPGTRCTLPGGCAIRPAALAATLNWPAIPYHGPPTPPDSRGRERTRWDNPASMRIRVGTSGYSYKEWKGTFYPEDLPAAKIAAVLRGALRFRRDQQHFLPHARPENGREMGRAGAGRIHVRAQSAAADHASEEARGRIGLHPRARAPASVATFQRLVHRRNTVIQPYLRSPAPARPRTTANAGSGVSIRPSVVISVSVTFRNFHVECSRSHGITRDHFSSQSAPVSHTTGSPARRSSSSAWRARHDPAATRRSLRAAPHLRHLHWKGRQNASAITLAESGGQADDRSPFRERCNVGQRVTATIGGEMGAARTTHSMNASAS
jgi:hypothetical protein